MDVEEIHNHTVDPEVRAYIYSLVSAVGQSRTWIQNQLMAMIAWRDRRR